MTEPETGDNAAICFSYEAFPWTVNEMFRSASTAKAASGTMCSPFFKTLPENRPRRNPRAFFWVSSSGNVITTMTGILSRTRRVFNFKEVSC